MGGSVIHLPVVLDNGTNFVFRTNFDKKRHIGSCNHRDPARIWRKGLFKIYFWNNCASVFCGEGEKRHFESSNPFR